MDDSSDLTAFEELGPTRRSTCGDRQTQSLRPSAETRRLISELGLRYRPSVQADLEAHAAQLALLAKDVAEVDYRDLSDAIAKHVRQSPFLPKACELLQLADDARLNREWKERTAEQAYLPSPVTVRPEPEPFVPCTPEEAEAILKEFGLKANPLDRIVE
jgi:hypothetical protein